jgi:CheY-like chemotaxis protein
VTRRIIALVDDMIFAARIRGTAESVGIAVHLARSIDAVCELAVTEETSLIIADLHTTCCDPFALAQRLKSDKQLSSIQLMGFFSHVQTALKEKAESAGYDRVLPRSAFTKNLPMILEGRY